MKAFSVAAFLFVLFVLTSCKKGSHPSEPMNPPSGGNTWIVSTIAGNGIPFFADGPALLASFKDPIDAAVSNDGTVYVADPITHRIRKISGGSVSTFAGDGSWGIADGTNAEFELPSQVIVDANGNVYTLDIDDPRVRKITPDGNVSSIAGNGQVGFKDGAAKDAEFGQETSGLTIDAQGNILVVDFDNKRIRKISSNGQVSTIAGNGKQGFVDGLPSDAEFFAPSGIATDKDGNIFVGDGNRVRKITASGIVSTYAGGSASGYRDGTANEAQFTSIDDMVIDDQGDIFLTDQNRIREIDQHGIVSTIAGNSSGYKDGAGSTAQFYSPAGLGMDKQGNLVVADVNNNRIRKISKQ
jgi:sugar lactone lactonase YvrE